MPVGAQVGVSPAVGVVVRVGLAVAGVDASVRVGLGVIGVGAARVGDGEPAMGGA